MRFFIVVTIKFEKKNFGEFVDSFLVFMYHFFSGVITEKGMGLLRMTVHIVALVVIILPLAA